MTVKNRVKAYCETIQMTVSAFEKSIGVANGYVNSISKSIGIDKISLILENYPNLNIEWLLTGRGEMLKTKHTPEVLIPENEPSSSNKDNKNEITKQDVSASIIERLLTTIQEQAEEIGRLRERVEQLECIKEAKERPVSGAQSSGLADVG
ncbi:hypothetical protein AAH076_00755 [Bacteroides xylanisolvens]|uniref:hypothetical protein n=1 Tax=Bacteroides xylanisolvens TaxID=371601 RepID=UPI0039B4AA1C